MIRFRIRIGLIKGGDLKDAHEHVAEVAPKDARASVRIFGEPRAPTPYRWCMHDEAAPFYLDAILAGRESCPDDDVIVAGTLVSASRHW